MRLQKIVRRLKRTGPIATSLFERSFSNGIVAVNPNKTAATITFTTPYRNLAGTEVTTETLAPDTADVFTAG